MLKWILVIGRSSIAIMFIFLPKIYLIQKVFNVILEMKILGKKIRHALAGVLSGLGGLLIQEKVSGLIPGKAHTQAEGLIPGLGAYGRQTTDVSL